MESKLENIEAKLKTQIGFFTSKTNANEKKWRSAKRIDSQDGFQPRGDESHNKCHPGEDKGCAKFDPKWKRPSTIVWGTSRRLSINRHSTRMFYNCRCSCSVPQPQDLGRDTSLRNPGRAWTVGQDSRFPIETWHHLSRVQNTVNGSRNLGRSQILPEVRNLCRRGEATEVKRIHIMVCVLMPLWDHIVLQLLDVLEENHIFGCCPAGPGLQYAIWSHEKSSIWGNHWGPGDQQLTVVYHSQLKTRTQCVGEFLQEFAIVVEQLAHHA
jgi:hypothetical protein